MNNEKIKEIKEKLQEEIFIANSFGDTKELENLLTLINELENENKQLKEHIAELKDKELPCKVGDTVYFPVDNGWDCAEIDEIHIFDDDIVFEWVQYDRGYELTELWDEGDFSIHDIGKTVFLTREKAETKLRELKGEV